MRCSPGSERRCCADAEAPREPLEVQDLSEAALFALAVLVPAWIFRRVLASMPLAATFPATLLGLCLFATCLCASNLVTCTLFGGGVEELQDSHGVVAQLVMSVLLVVLGDVAAMSAVAQTFYISLPLAWLGVWVVWRASSGFAPPEYSSARLKRA